MEEKESRTKVQGILPATGIWTVEGLAKYLGIQSGAVQDKLTEMGVPVKSFTIRYRHKIFFLEDLREKSR